MSDNGEGIPRVEHRRIFDKFYRIDDRLSREREGSGLGLAIVKHIVRAHHGRVQLDSAVGQGVHVPHRPAAGRRREGPRPRERRRRRRRSAHERGQGRRRARRRSGACSSSRTTRASCSGLRINLEAEGYVVLSAEDGEQGLELARAERPDLVILDVMLPKMNGFQVLQTLRREGLAMPIIVLSARTGEMDKVTGLELGAEDYVAKPFSLAELLARVRAALRRGPRPVEAPRTVLRVRRRARRRGGAHGDARGRAGRDDGDRVRRAALPHRGARRRARPRGDLRARVGPEPPRDAAHDRQLHPAAPRQARARPAEAAARA